MPRAHMNYVFNEAERDTWPLCMDQAIDQQNYSEDFDQYLKAQLRFPAKMIRKTSRNG